MAVTASAAFTHQIDALQGKGRRGAGRANAVNIFGIRLAHAPSNFHSRRRRKARRPSEAKHDVRPVTQGRSGMSGAGLAAVGIHGASG